MAPVDLSASIYAQYKRARKRAEEAEKRGSAKEAAAAYRHAAAFMRQYGSSSRDTKIRKSRLERADALDALANRLQQGPTAISSSVVKAGAQPAEVTGEDDYDNHVLGLIQRTDIGWDDIGGLDDTKIAIKSAYGLALARKPEGVTIESWRNFLLFGPPGTGKTLLAAATAGSLDATFFSVKVSDMLSKYFGESTKLISALYATAARLSPSVIFLDEFESLSPPRGSGDSGAERRIVSTLLAEIDGLNRKGSQDLIITIGATNLPWLIDTAILSRFQKRVYVPLPDAAARRIILEIFIDRRGHDTQLSLARLVERTAGYSGREIEQICQTAVTHMTQRANPDLMAIVDQGRDAIRDYEIRVETLSEHDFKIALNEAQPGSNAAMLARYQTWIKQIED
jgi:katanin p60 ATPase-containing subunit A1